MQRRPTTMFRGFRVSSTQSGTRDAIAGHTPEQRLHDGHGGDTIAPSAFTKPAGDDIGP